jgi:hypothetical protein
LNQLEKLKVLIKEKQVQVANQGKYTPQHVVNLVREATGLPFNINHHTNAWKLNQVRPQKKVPHGCKIEYCQYDEAHKDIVYTDKWVQLLIEKVMDPVKFEEIKN